MPFIVDRYEDKFEVKEKRDRVTNIIHHTQLGDLYYTKGPKSIHCWQGTITGCEQGFYIILESQGLEVIEADFISDVIKNWERYEEKALEYIRIKLATQSESFDVSKEIVENALRLKDVPFRCPQFVFYEKQEWAIIFLENDLEIGEPFGVSVEFNGNTLTRICDLADSEEIEDYSQMLMKRKKVFILI